MCVLKTGACLIQVHFNVIAIFGKRIVLFFFNTGCVLNGDGNYDRFHCSFTAGLKASFSVPG